MVLAEMQQNVVVTLVNVKAARRVSIHYDLYTSALAHT